MWDIFLWRVTNSIIINLAHYNIIHASVLHEYAKNTIINWTAKPKQLSLLLITESVEYLYFPAEQGKYCQLFKIVQMLSQNYSSIKLIPHVDLKKKKKTLHIRLNKNIFCFLILCAS